MRKRGSRANGKEFDRWLGYWNPVTPETQVCSSESGPLAVPSGTGLLTPLEDMPVMLPGMLVPFGPG